MIRVYKEADKSEILNLIKLNTPNYFDYSEEAELKKYLENSVESYFVFIDNYKVIGCGGINYFQVLGEARISWDIIHPDYHGKGIGSKLVLYRLAEIFKNKAIRRVVVRTSQHAFQFYEKMGFKLININKDFWSTGFDLYFMEMKIA